jgi:hypothetical protein
MGASMLNSTENSSSQNVSPCDSDSSLTVIGSSDQFPPYQVSHSSNFLFGGTKSGGPMIDSLFFCEVCNNDRD